MPSQSGKKASKSKSASSAKKKPRSKTSASTAKGRASAGRKSTARKTSTKKTTSKKKATGRSKATTSKKKKAPARSRTAKAATGSAGSKKTKKKTSASRPSTTKRAGASASKSKKSSAARSSSRKKKTTKKTSAAATSKKKSTRKASGKTSKRGGTKRGSAASSNSNTSKSTTRSVANVASHAKADADGYVLINGRKVRMISTKGFTKAKRVKSAPPANSADAQIAERERIKLVKTRLTAKELRNFRNLLLIKRAEIIGDLDAMEAEALRSGSGDITHMPIHMADIGTDTYDQDFMLNMAETERRRIREIDEAIARIDNKTYGVCQMTGKPIPKSRLNAKPWAKYTIEAARMIEQGYGG